MEISYSAFQKLPTIALQGKFFRIVSRKHQDEILDTQGSLEFGGRYNSPGVAGVLYLGESKEVCKAEREKKGSSALLLPQVIATIKVSLQKVLDLTNPDSLKIIGIKKQDLLRSEREGDGYELPRKLAAWAYRVGYEALLVPSTTGKGKNLVVFLNQCLKSSIVEVISKGEE
jgi:RES domain-containing protein